MSVFAIQAGTTIKVNDKTYSLLRQVEPGVWQAEELRTKRIHEFRDDELRASYKSGQLSCVTELPRVRSATEPTTADYSSEQWHCAKMRRAYVKAVLDLPSSRCIVGPVVEDTWRKLREPEKPPSVSTVLKWKRWYLQGGKSIQALVDRHDKKGNRSARYPEEVECLARQAIESEYLTLERKPLVDALDKAKQLVDAENALRPPSLQLPRPTLRLMRRLLETYPAFDRDAARYGRASAIRRYRGVLKRRIVGAPLEVAEIDHTPLDLMLVDDRYLLPLGRPWLTVCVDVFTRNVLGLYVSFEPPSYFTVARCLKHAVLPKSDLKVEYPSIENSWEAHGVMAVLCVDNGREFHSQSLENAAYSLGIEVRYSPRKAPWHKGHVERFIGTCNRGVAHGLPGTTFANILEKDEYNPSKHAVLRFSAFKEILYTWICDVYHQRPHRGLDGRSPAAVWASSVSPEDILLPDDPARLDAILGRSEIRTLTHKGIELDGLQYNSPDLIRLRMRHGEKLKVEIRIDDADLGSIIVLGPEHREPITVPSLDLPYAEGLTRYQHRICKRYAQKEFARSTPETWLRAKARIGEIIEGEYARKRSTTRKRVARFRGERALIASKPELPSPPLQLSPPSAPTVGDEVARPKSNQGDVLQSFPTNRLESSNLVLGYGPRERKDEIE